MTYAERYPHAHPASLALLPFFEFAHLPAKLQTVSEPFHNLAHALLDGVDGNSLRTPLNGPELTVALRKLLEAKDCAVRAAL